MRLTLAFLFVLMTCLLKAQPLELSNFENLNIRNVGPANMSGRITAIDAVQDNPNIIYVGAASGGVWKSENGGSAWKPVFDDQPTQNIGAIAIQQDNPSVVWVGTGEGNPRNSMNLGMGIFKSLDGGRTWTHLGLEATKTIHRIIIDPGNPEIVYAGALGDPWTPGEDRGLYKTTDGGLTWEKILYTNDQSGIADLVMDPSNPNKLIAAVYEHRRTPYYFTSGGPGSGLFITYDGGENWKRYTEADGLPSGDLGRIGLAIAPSDPNRMYAKVEATKNALYRSDDGGVSWYLVNDNPRFTNNRPFYFQELAVDSKDPNRLYNIYQPLTLSYDGGKTFDPVPMIPADETKGIHADFHAFWMNPQDPRHFIIGGDGGLGITRDHGKSWYFPETIPVAQFYHINADNDLPYNVYGGMQDNGNWSGPGYTWKRGGIRTLYWQYLVGGDGFYIQPDPDNSRFGYGTSQNGNLYRYDKLTGYYSSIKPRVHHAQASLRFNWNAAFAQAPLDKNTIYYGSQFVHKSTDKGASWEIISPDLSTNNPEHQKGDYGGLTLDISGAENYNSILSIAPSPLDQNLIWAGTDDGQLHLTRDGGKTWNNLTLNIKGMPHEAWIARIQASRFEAGAAWVVVNNYRKGDYKPYLFKTEDYGKTWKQMADEKKVRGYALSVAQDTEEPNLVFLGTEHGLWISIDKGNNWTQFKNGFPSVSTMDLKIQESESALIVGTFGRAIWILDDLNVLRAAAAMQLKDGLTALPMNDAVQVKGLFIAPPGNIWTGFHTTFEGENRVFQKVKVPFYINEQLNRSSKVKATIYDENDRLINTLATEPNAKGLNYLTWKLDEQAANLPGAWITEESRGIPVLPGRYKIVLECENFKDSTAVRVIPDPRFDLSPEVDEQLYAYQKEVDQQVELLASLLQSLDHKKEALTKLEKQLKEWDDQSKNALLQLIKEMRSKMADLRASGQTPRPERQVGAWQTSIVTPYSKVRAVQQIAMSRTRPISEQERQLLEEAAQLVQAFGEKVNEFQEREWDDFVQKLKQADINWLFILK
jgi:photosystem II stability/assembly factor-like uncharacterized protein